MRHEVMIGMVLITIAYGVATYFYAPSAWAAVVIGPVFALALRDIFQTEHTILRAFPVLGHARYLLEKIRPEIRQYFIESDHDGRPFNRELRSIVYQRSKDALETLPFGTRMDVYAVGYEWFNHSLAPRHIDPESLRVTVGGKDCKQPYSASIYNISAMSFGSLSKNAVLALNGGAKLGKFAHNTGEGGISPYHVEPGGDLIWQIGTGYFGCRNDDGTFNLERFVENATRPTVKMIEVKLSQGAKPGHGGILPAKKLTAELAQIRHVPMGKDVLSPPAHSTFDTPVGLLEWIAQLREASGGKPVGFKLCIGKRREFLAICKAMVQTGIKPDYIAVDGGEGGTGAAPLEFSNHLGTPLTDGLVFVHNALVGFNLRDDIRVIASGRVMTANGLLKCLALGADLTYAARAYMLAIGCIQALECNSNRCPTGVATQNPGLVAALVPEDKAKRTHLFHHNTVEAAAEMLGAMGLEHTLDLRPWHILRRTALAEIRHYGDMYPYLEPGALLSEPYPSTFERAMKASSPDHFRHCSAA
jgi:glutamate synthase domain-containing protein 2